MSLHRLSLFSIAVCLAGLVVLMAVAVRSTQQMQEQQFFLAELLQLSKRIDHFSAASDSLLVLGADVEVWRAYRDEAQKLRAQLEALGDEAPGAINAAQLITSMASAVSTALEVPGDVREAAQQGGLEPLEVPDRSRIIMQELAEQGTVLDEVLDGVLNHRQQAIAQEARRMGAVFEGSALVFGALCVVAFGLIHWRIAQPVRRLGNTLEKIRAGDTAARATISGTDELAQLAQTVNKLLDERQNADRAVVERQYRLEQVLSQLRATRDQLVRAQRVGNIGSWEFDFKSRQLQWSDQAFEIFGLEREKFGGSIEDLLKLVHAEDRDRLRSKRAAWLEQGGEFETEYRIVRPDGEVRWVHARAQLITAPDGSLGYSTGTLQDLTDRRQQESRTRQLYRLLDGSDDLCGIVDDSSRYLWVNKAYARIYDLCPDALVARSVADVVGDTYFETIVRPLLERCLAGTSQQFETERELPRLGRRRLLARYYPIDVPDEPRRHVGFILTDVTDIRAAEAEVARRGRLLAIAGRAARFGGWSVDLETSTCEWSDVTAAIHCMPAGYAPSLEQGIAFYAPEHRARIIEVFTACAERGEPYDEELQIIDGDGQRRWVRTVAEAVRDDRGAIIRVQGAFQDISERKQLELDRERLMERLVTMLDSITDGFIAFDQHWRYTYVNAEGARLIGKNAQELTGTSLWSQFPEVVGSQMEATLRQAMDERRPGAIEEYFEPLETWFELRAYPWEEGVAVFFHDVSETRRMVTELQNKELALLESRDALEGALRTRQALINSLPAHIALLDHEGVVIDVNEQWRCFGEQNDFAGGGFGLGSNYLDVCEAASGDCADDAVAVANGLRAVLAGECDRFALEYPCHSPLEKRWFRVIFNRLVAGQAVSGGVVAMHVDITERKLAEQQLEKLAYQDGLTGLLSRNGFTQRLQALLDDGNWPSGGIVVMLDVVNHRDINDVHGYEVGDRLLIELGRRVQSECAPGGLAGRAGGDEFVVYLAPDAQASIEQRLGSLYATLKQVFRLAELDIDIDVWMGFTVLGERERHPADLVREAELAMFESRGNARGQPHWTGYTAELDVRTSERIRLTRELRHAIEAQEFELHFQPKVNLRDGSLISAEALIRWRHPERGLLPPGLFIPIAEQSQLIGPIGDWALRDACRQLRDWRAESLEIVRVSVNVSLVQFAPGGFPAKVKAALDEFGVAPGELSLEITESVFEQHSDDLLAQLRELHDLGVRLSLDDFGTGYSSLLYLQRYPFDEIKIDRGFVSRLLDDDYSRDIVRTVIDIAGALGAEVVAEGIESAEIAAALVDMGIRIGQGFYYSMPLVAEDFRWLLEKRSPLPLRVGENGL